MSTIEVYDSFSQVPLDAHDPAEDGDDRLVPGAYGAIHEPPVALSLVAAMPLETLVVPFKGPLRQGARGRPVIALKRALGRAPRPGGGHYLPWLGRAYTPYLGPVAMNAVVRFKRDHNLGDDRIYGGKAHAKLARYYDDFAIQLLLYRSLDDRQREAMLAQFMYLYNVRWLVPYSQRRPYDRRRPPTLGEDCSSSGNYAAEFAGLRDLSGFSGFGYGNTDTQLSHFRALHRVRESISNAKTGDPKYYGSGWDPSHVSWVVGRDAGVVRVFSMGSFPAKILAHDYRHDGIAVCNLTGG